MGCLLKRLCLGTAAAWLLAAPAAHAFTIENGDGGSTGSGFSGSPYAAPKFDLEEQARNFTKGGNSITSPGGKADYSTPLGNGTMQFNVQQGSAFGSGMGFGTTRANRMDFERMVTPDGLR